ncbi:MAG: flavodoxin family protein [Firmicutes bacterium]|nr:flavodoxin family protein [Bacillota bacterium]
MKILILNGSPRQGNTVAAIEALKTGIGTNHQVEVVDTYKLQVAPCKACDVCQCENDCIDQDDTHYIVDKMMDADMLVFCTPVYWCGISAQLKLIIDKCYSKHKLMHGKKTGCIAIGAEPASHPLYENIMAQFAHNEDYLSWEPVFKKYYSAWAANELAENQAVLDQLTALGQEL